jgi:PIN domain nuclease of toxin-antitoxin system
VRILLDTRILLWWLCADEALPPRAGRLIASSDTAVVVSAASAWEIASKKAAGRLDAPDDVLEALDASAFDTLPITAAHALAAGALPLHHGDLFDRMLIAQARMEGLTLVTVDERFAEYDVDLLTLG